MGSLLILGKEGPRMKTTKNKTKHITALPMEEITIEEVRALVAELRKRGVDAYTGDQMDQARGKRNSR
jgi:hypothetical protein